MPDDPAVALVHGFASSFAHGWEHNGWTDLLADAGRKVVRVDLPGHGQSPPTTDPAAFADVQGTLAEAIAPHAPVDAVGFSTGARLLLPYEKVAPVDVSIAVGVAHRMRRVAAAKPALPPREIRPVHSPVVIEVRRVRHVSFHHKVHARIEIRSPHGRIHLTW